MRAEMEARFGHDFGRIRVHADPAAAELARDHGGRAVAAGPSIHFAAGEYRPETPAGRRLLAHELAHTLQQPTPLDPARAAGPPSRPHEAVEREADRLADRALARAPAGSVGEPLRSTVRSIPRPLLAPAPAAAAPAPAAPAPAAAAPAVDPMQEFYPCSKEQRVQIKTAVDGAQTNAGEVADRLEKGSRRILRRFERIFGDRSQAARDKIVQTLRGVEGLATTTVQGAASKTTVFLGCASVSSSVGAFYAEPEVRRSPITRIETVDAPARIGFGDAFFAYDSAIRQQADVLHEMVHAVQKTRGIDVYFGSRLFEVLSQLQAADGTTFATVNPDSITAFVYLALSSLGGIGKGNLPAGDVTEAFRGPADTTTAGFAGKPEERATARAALGLMETWVDVAEKRLGSAVNEIVGTPFGWEDFSSDSRATIALLAGAELDARGQPGPCGVQLGFPAACPAAAGPLGGAEAVIKAQAERLAALRHRLSGKATEEERQAATVTDDSGEEKIDAGLLPQERGIRLKRRERAAGASFKAGKDPESGRLRPDDVFTLPPSFFKLPNLGEQASALLELYVGIHAAGGPVGPLISFIERNAVRRDQPSAVALGKLGASAL